jgi:hypothetical protein
MFLPYSVERADFDTTYDKLNGMMCVFFLSPKTKKYFPSAHETRLGSINNIFWDSVYVDGDGHWSWCQSNERVPLNVVPTKDGKPHVGAMTRAGDRHNLYLLSISDSDVNCTLFCFSKVY